MINICATYISIYGKNALEPVHTATCISAPCKIIDMSAEAKWPGYKYQQSRQ